MKDGGHDRRNFDVFKYFYEGARRWLTVNPVWLEILLSVFLIGAFLGNMGLVGPGRIRKNGQPALKIFREDWYAPSDWSIFAGKPPMINQ